MADKEVHYSLAQVPQDIRTCFTKLTGMPMPGAMSARQVTYLVGKLRASEKRKSACGRRLLNIYDTQAKAMKGQ